MEKHRDVTEVLSAVSKVALGVFTPTVADLITFHGSLKVWHQPKRRKNGKTLYISGGHKVVLVVGGQGPSCIAGK